MIAAPEPLPVTKTPTLLVVVESIRGGQGFAALAHSTWFSNQGWRVVLAAPNSAPSTTEGMEVVRIPLPSSARNLRGMFRAGRAIRRIRDRSSVVVTHCHGLRAFTASLLGGVRAYVTMHHFGSAKDDPILYHALRWIAMRLTPFAALHAFTGEPALGPGWRFLPHASPLLDKLSPSPPPTGVFTILWCGRFDGRKCPEVFVEAVARAAKVRPVRGVMIGEGDLVHEIQALIDSLEAPVELVGSVDDVRPWIERTSACALFTRFEAPSFAVQEAMWVGRPVIVTDLPALRWLVGDAGIVVPNDSEAAAEAILKLSDSQLSQDLGKRAYERIRSILSPESPWSELAKYYERSLINLARRSSHSRSRWINRHG